MKSPCKGCQDRILGCHSSCERYRVYHDCCETTRQNRQKINDLEAPSIVLIRNTRKKLNREKKEK